MKSVMLFFAVFGLFLLFSNFDYLKDFKLGLNSKQLQFFNSAIFAVFVVIIANFINTSKEGFFFTLTPNRPVCSKMTVGRPIGFEFTPDAERGCPQNCCKPVGPRYGWDGFLAHNVGQTCQAGGCTRCDLKNPYQNK